MKRKDIQKYILLLLFMVTAQLALAQSFMLQGKVSDKDGNPIELASVMVVSQGKLSMTNLKGEFNMQLQSEDSVKVRFSMIGYRTKTRVLVRPKGKQTLLIQLADDNELQEVVVEGKNKQHGTTEELDIQKTKQGPSTSGNAWKRWCRHRLVFQPTRSCLHNITSVVVRLTRTLYISTT